MQDEINQPVEEQPTEEATPSRYGFTTTEKVSFIVNGKKSEGTEFTFDTQEEMEAREQMLVERFGKGIVK